MKRQVSQVLIILGLVAAFGATRADGQAPTTGMEATAPSDTITLTLAEAYSQALGQNSGYLAERQEVEIARGQLTQAGGRAANPELELEAPGFGSGGISGEFQVGVAQELEVGGQRSARIRAANIGVDRATATVANAERQILAEVGRAFYTAVAAERRLGVARELTGLFDQLITVTRIQAREGEISVMDANLAEIESGRARARLLAAQRESTNARLELQRLTGFGISKFVLTEELQDSTGRAIPLSEESLLERALAVRPDLSAARLAAEQYEALTELARREARPNVQVAVFIEREELAVLSEGAEVSPRLRTQLDSPQLGFGVSVALPLFRRNRGLVAERTAQAQQAQLQRRATELDIRTEVEDALQAYRSATEEARVYEQEVLVTTRQNQQLLEVAFRAGKVGLPTLLLLRNQLLDAELGYWDAWLAEGRALIDLQSATATLRDTLSFSAAGGR